MNDQEKVALDAIMRDVTELHEAGRVRGCVIAMTLDDGDVRMHSAVFDLRNLILLLGGVKFTGDQISAMGRDAVSQQQVR